MSLLLRKFLPSRQRGIRNGTTVIFAKPSMWFPPLKAQKMSTRLDDGKLIVFDVNSSPRLRSSSVHSMSTLGVIIGLYVIC